MRRSRGSSIRCPLVAALVILLAQAMQGRSVPGRNPGQSQLTRDGATQLTCTPAGLNFQRVIIGQAGTISVTMTNTGSTGVTVSKMKRTARVFAVSNLSLPLTLSAGQSVSFQVTFKPTSTGNVAGDIVFQSNASNGVLDVPASGTGVVNWSLTANPPSLKFGGVPAGTSLTLPVSLTNSGTSTITVSQEKLTGTEFSFSGLSLPLQLAGGQSYTFHVKFAPTSSGPATGSMWVSNPSDPILKIPVSGTGTPSVYLSWEASTSRHVVGYNIYRHAVGASYKKINSILNVTTTYTDISVAPGGTYFYATTAVNSRGQESALSNQVKVPIP
jgi:Abnormal spindle-like microcephaly-assoc'd, ASPM-SPD-2-Hydin/Cep192 domain 4